jgi:hypothetical protein
MRPTIKEMTDGILWALESRVIPATTDKWALSYLRGITGILRHIGARDESYRAILMADTEDQKELLSLAAKHTGESVAWTRFKEQVSIGVSEEPRRREGGEPRSLEELEQSNSRYRQLIQQLVVAIHESGDDRKDKLHREVIAYFRRQTERERPIIEGPFSGPPY